MSKEVMLARMKQAQQALSAIPGVYLQDVRKFVEGNISLTRKGVLKMPLCLDAEDVLHEGADVSAVIKGEWKIVPLLLFISSEETPPPPLVVPPIEG